MEEHFVITGLAGGFLAGAGIAALTLFLIKRYLIRAEKAEALAIKADANATKALDGVYEVKAALDKKKDIVVCEVSHKELEKFLKQILETSRQTAKEVSNLSGIVIRLEEKVRGNSNG